jgi:hypothetical protein
MTTAHRPSAALTHSVLAAALVDADRLAAWRADPGRLEEYGIEPSTMDLDGLADFAGLAERVRHNQCRRALQLTFRLLWVANLEVAFFRDYTPVSLQRRRAGLNTTADRIAGLAEFMAEWAEGDPTRGLVRETLDHEHIVARLRHAEVPVPPPGAGASRPDEPAVPLPNGRLVVRTSSCNPRQVAEVLKASEPDLGLIERGSWTLIYRRGFDGSLTVSEVDRGLGALVSVVAGDADVAALAGRLRVPHDLLSAMLDRLTGLGMFWWRSGETAMPCE